MENLCIDINCDVGEGLGNESKLLPLISSCNIACGGHAGDVHTIREVLVLAREHNVKIGAHPSYPDKENFGRVSMTISEKDLINTIEQQVDSFVKIAASEDTKIHHIKAHGALYNDMAKNLGLARTFLKAISKYKESVYLYVPYASVICKEALDQGFQVKREAFADRNYNMNYSLVSRKLPDAVIEDPKRVLDHLLFMIQKKGVKVASGNVIPITADTYCVHGDTASALQILMYLSKELPNLNIQVA